MLRWSLASLPGAFLVFALIFSMGVGLAGPWLAVVISAAATALFAVLWHAWAPFAAERDWLKRHHFLDSEVLRRSWKRAFDGHRSARRALVQEPRLLLWDFPGAEIMVWRLPLGRPTILVSTGWLAHQGEQGFRSACRVAQQRLGDPHLPLYSRAAFLLAATTRRVSPAFSSAFILPCSLRSESKGVNPWVFAFALPWIAWLGWIRAVLGGAARLDSPEGAQWALSPGARLRLEAGTEVCCQWLSLDRASGAARASKTILSWLPANW